MVLERDALGGIPNGIALSPDERYLYSTALQKMMRYEVKPDGTLGAGTLFTEARHRRRHEGRLQGNVFSTSGAGPASSGSRRRRARCSATSICRSTAASRSGRSARRTSRSATPTARAVYHGLRRGVPDPDEGGRRDAGTAAVAVNVNQGVVRAFLLALSVARAPRKMFCKA